MKKTKPDLRSICSWSEWKRIAKFIEGEWLSGTHKHCRSCGAEVTFLRRLKWKVDSGVRAIGVCLDCGILVVESEHRSFRNFFRKLRRVRL